MRAGTGDLQLQFALRQVSRAEPGAPLLLLPSGLQHDAFFFPRLGCGIRELVSGALEGQPPESCHNSRAHGRGCVFATLCPWEWREHPDARPGSGTLEQDECFLKGWGPESF